MPKFKKQHNQRTHLYKKSERLDDKDIPSLKHIRQPGMGIFLCEIPREKRTEELCNAAVHSDGRALKFVPRELITQELCSIACESRTEALKHVPMEFQTMDMYQKYIQSIGHSYNLCKILTSMSRSLSAEKICLALVQQNNECLQDIPQYLRTKEIRLAANQ